MSLLFWRKTTDTGEYRPDGKAQTKDVVVTTEEPLPVTLVANEESPYYPVRIPEDGGYQAPIAGQTITRFYKVPGIGTGAAYTSGDAFGTVLKLHDLFRPEKCSGTITGMFLIDLDDEGLQVDVPLFVQPITATTDNDAFAVSDADLMYCRAVFSITEFYNWSTNQFGQYTGTPKWISAASPHLWTQLSVIGAANIAAGAEPWLGVIVVSD